MLNYRLVKNIASTIEFLEATLNRFANAYPLYRVFVPLQEFINLKCPLSEEELYHLSLTYLPRQAAAPP